MLAEDLADYTSGSLYVAALGFTFPDRQTVEKINAPIPRTQLERYKKGVYEWQVIEEEELPRPYKRNDLLQAITKMAKKYGSLEEYKPVSINLSHEDRIKIANQVATELIKESYTGSVYLTGSTASNSDRLDSDVDLLTILNFCPGLDGHNKMDKLTMNFQCPIDIFYIQQSEFSKAKDSRYPLIKDRVLLATK